MLGGLLLFAAGCVAAPADGTAAGATTLRSGWQYRWGDSPRTEQGSFRWASADDEPGWRDFEFPEQPPQRGDAVNAWQRVRLPEARYRDPALFVFSIDTAVEIYLREKLIYRHGEFDESGAARFPGWKAHIISLPEDYAGQWLYFRVHSRYADIGVYREARLSSRSAHILRILRQDVGQLLVSIVLMFVGLVALLLSAGGEQFEAKRGRYYFAAFAFFAGLWALTHTHAKELIFDAPLVWTYAFFVAVFTIPVATCGYFESLFDRGPWDIVAWLRRGALLMVSGMMAYAIYDPVPMLGFLPADLAYVIIILSLATLAVQRAIRGDPDARLLTGGMLVYFVFMFHDVLADAGIEVLFPDAIAYWGLLALIVSLIVVERRRIDRLQRSNEEQARELEERNAALLRMDSLKDEFLAITSHELRTPLAGMVGLVDSLLAGAGGMISDMLRRNLELISVSAERLANLVERLLDLSLLRHGAIRIQATTIDLIAAVESVFGLLHSVARQNDVQLRLVLEAPLPMARADDERLQQILINLLDNAIRHSCENEVVVRLDNEVERIRVAVIDQGEGIPGEAMPLLFEPFARIHNSSGLGPEGAGLGLSIAQGLVRLHGSELHVASKPGERTEFWFYLPVESAESENLAPPCLDSVVAHPPSASSAWIAGSRSARAATVPASVNGAHGRILVVDDEEIIRRALENQLGLEGYEVHSVPGGAAALAALDAQSYDLLIADVMMPGLSGLDVCRRLRQRRSLHELPILILSARGASTDIALGFESGANDYLVKPFQRSELVARVGTLVALKQAAEESQRGAALSYEMSMARQTLQALLPRPPTIEGLRIAVGARTAATVSGDYFDFARHDGGLGVFLGDVTGHGMPAALFTAMLRISFRLRSDLHTEPAALFAAMNAGLYGDLDHNFVSAIYVFIDQRRALLRIACAGHPPLIIQNRADGDLRRFKPAGPPLGIVDAPRYEVGEAALRPGRRLLLYTDGVLECENASGEEFGARRFGELIADFRSASAQDFADALMMELDRFVRDGRQQDDCAVVVVDFD